MELQRWDSPLVKVSFHLRKRSFPRIEQSLEALPYGTEAVLGLLDELADAIEIDVAIGHIAQFTGNHSLR
jgi:hypothetical protein